VRLKAVVCNIYQLEAVESNYRRPNAHTNRPVIVSSCMLAAGVESRDSDTLVQIQ